MITNDEILKGMKILKEEYSGWDNVESRHHIDNGVFSTQKGYREVYFITGVFKEKEVYFIKYEYFFDNKKDKTVFLRTYKNKKLMEFKELNSKNEVLWGDF